MCDLSHVHRIYIEDTEITRQLNLSSCQLRNIDVTKLNSRIVHNMDTDIVARRKSPFDSRELLIARDVKLRKGRSRFQE